MRDKEKVVVLGGTTCSGKTGLSLSLSAVFPFEIVNFDSMCFYRYFDIGTAKPDERERSMVPHHLLDIRYPDEDYNAAMFSDDASLEIKGITGRGKIPLLTGGTGLYARALLFGLSPIPDFDKGYFRARALELIESAGIRELYEKVKKVDPVYAGKISPNDTVRITRAYEVFAGTGRPLSYYISENPFGNPRYDYLYFVLLPSKERLKSCIMERTKKMIRGGLTGEIEMILKKGYSGNLKPFKSIGYKEGLMYINGEIKSESELASCIIDSSMKYAKRQATYFKKMKGAVIINNDDPDSVTAKIKSIMETYI